MIDLWSDDDDLEALAASLKPAPIAVKNEVEATVSQRHTVPDGADLCIVLDTFGDETRIYITSNLELDTLQFFQDLRGVNTTQIDTQWCYSMKLRPLNAFLLRHILRGLAVDIAPDAAAQLSQEADKMPSPRGTLSADKKHLEFVIPGADPYRAVMRKLNAYPAQGGTKWRANISRAIDIEPICKMSLGSLPKIVLDDSIQHLLRDPIPGFDGSLQSLKNISINELNIVKADVQTAKNRKQSTKSLSEKLESFGISSLYDLLLHLPRRYIDKSKPQDIRSLVVDESATIVGVVKQIDSLSKNMGVRFTIDMGNDDTIDVTFWRQTWLGAKFPIGTEVIITGKFNVWNNKPTLNGASIEHSEEGVLLPIMPIYKQSVSKGITTAFLVSAVRELFSRIGTIELPFYLQHEGRIDYTEAYRELHLPSSLEHHNKVIDNLAYYELVDMQLIIQEEHMRKASKSGIRMEAGPRNLQKKAIEMLTFDLTPGQVDAVTQMNEKMAGTKPTVTLLNADVGCGKTIISQLACLRAVEAGYQALLIAPTDVLTRQLYNTLQKIVDGLAEKGETVTIEFLSSSLKVGEKRRILKDVKSGKIDILVGMGTLINIEDEYHNLGLICIDEQQKFGAEARSALLTSRSDNLVPHMLMQSATPIPRSTAQVFYGDIDMILLTDKPKGRLPVETVWIQQDPNEVQEQLLHPMWGDIINEAKQGNQTFIITPLVNDSDKIEASSVMRTHELLSQGALNGLNVGFVHGKMKIDEQQQAMKDFRDKKYDVLVASTIVEVGVDVPDATRVVVLSAERFGSSSLHQIRGRVGRNDKPSKCYLVTLALNPKGAYRMESLVRYSNGFDVAKSDLVLRGEGQIFGTNQAGATEMIHASLARHSQWIPDAQKEAKKILDGDRGDEALALVRQNFNMEEILK